ncbi:hypothetical protein HJC23_009581 [Cyclotella cryptica]|uniref:Protein kinase domain-containing protein n=1 Tax=Cyclotella cryptica TaxID=29204 RepID=A0ABD3PR08_9STRA|eukprot:CCRYP_012547-RA/>CCRYP_012547-RA protein AED:0.16 eAED:0.16 QI:385/1/1/1/0.66/0.5/4/1872/476
MGIDSSVAPLPQWPNEVLQKYTPIRVLGRGGFGCVYMAKVKNAKPDSPSHVAIKVVGSDGYAEREATILSELMKYSHPNIIKLFGRFEPRNDECARPCLVLSLACGPTLSYILKKGGALSLLMAKTISRQLIHAVAFLHGHAVIHRDIQPCNIIVSGTSLDDELWWSDELDVDGKVLGYVQRCHITIIDFGFARALCPDDLLTDVGLDKIVRESQVEGAHSHTESREQDEVKDERDSPICVNSVLFDTSFHQKRGRSRTRDTPALDTSQSYKVVRDLSALGTRNYAAPEILSGLRKISSTMASLNSSLHSRNSLDNSRRDSRKVQTRRSLAECVSSYGMVADAFSVGATIRYMVTGVPPEYNVDEYIDSKNHPWKRIVRVLKQRRHKNGKRIKHYRPSDELPNDVKDIIHALTHYDSRRRATVRMARSHKWVVNGECTTECDTSKSITPSYHGGPIVYLECNSKKCGTTIDEDDSV